MIHIRRNRDKQFRVVNIANNNRILNVSEPFKSKHAAYINIVASSVSAFGYQKSPKAVLIYDETYKKPRYAKLLILDGKPIIHKVSNL